MVYEKESKKSMVYEIYDHFFVVYEIFAVTYMSTSAIPILRLAIPF
jgi:hypothetical protein